MPELSGLEVFALAKEIESGLRGTYVKNVYSLGESQVLRFGRPEEEDVYVVASPKCGVWISKAVTERAETTGFTTRLRQELLRERFASARQLNDDRVFDLTFGEGGEAKHLIVELMPPGNVVVTDSENRVLALQGEVRTPTRRLVRGGAYSSPTQRRKNPASASASDVALAISRERTAGSVIGRSFSLPRKYIAEVLSRLEVEENTGSAALAGMEEEVAEVLRSLATEAKENPRPCVCDTPSGEEILVVKPSLFSIRKRSDSVSELCDEYLLETAATETALPDTKEEKRRRELETTISRLKARAEGLTAEASKLRGLAAKAKSATSVSEAKPILASAGAKEKRDLSSQEAAASIIYDMAKKLEAKAEDASRAADTLSKKKLGGEPKSKRTTELRRGGKEWYERFRWFVTSAGKLAVGGRDVQSNSILVKKYLEKGDTVYHADMFGSPFFILKRGSTQTDEERAEVAQATVVFSSAWKTGLGAADAYWVNPEQVSASAPSGEFLRHGSFVIRGRKNFISHNLVELAIGVTPEGKLVSGPETTIRKSASVYVVMRPQKEKSTETAKRVLKDLETLVGGGPAEQLTIDDVLRMLPAGGGKVLRKYSSRQLPSRNA